MIRKFCALYALSFLVFMISGAASIYGHPLSTIDLAIVLGTIQWQLLGLSVAFVLAVVVTTTALLMEPDEVPAPEKVVEKVEVAPLEKEKEHEHEHEQEQEKEQKKEKIAEPVAVSVPEPVVVKKEEEKPVKKAEPQQIVTPAKPVADPNETPAAAYQILFMFQKEGRLLDFLMEDIAGLDDETLGGAIRPIHEGCRNLLKDRLVIEPVISDPEGSDVAFDRPVSPDEIKLTGNVPPAPPFRGVVVHRGWRLKECHLPALVAGWAGKTVAPAEVEIG